MSDTIGTRDPKRFWAWVTEADGKISFVGVFMPALGEHMPLVGHNEDAVRAFKPMAEAHGRVSGCRVWLRRYTVDADLDVIWPPANRQN